MNTSEILREARSQVAAGWLQQAYCNTHTGAVCAVGGILSAEGQTLGITTKTVAGAAAVEALVRSIDGLVVEGDSFWNETEVECWNDAEHRTQADVVAAFDRAIVNEEAREQEFAADACVPAPAVA